LGYWTLRGPTGPEPTTSEQSSSFFASIATPRGWLFSWWKGLVWSQSNDHFSKGGDFPIQVKDAPAKLSALASALYTSNESTTDVVLEFLNVKEKQQNSPKVAQTPSWFMSWFQNSQSTTDEQLGNNEKFHRWLAGNATDSSSGFDTLAGVPSTRKARRGRPVDKEGTSRAARRLASKDDRRRIVDELVHQVETTMERIELLETSSA